MPKSDKQKIRELREENNQLKAMFHGKAQQLDKVRDALRVLLTTAGLYNEVEEQIEGAVQGHELAHHDWK